MDDYHILISAVRQGRVDKVRRMLNSLNLSFRKRFSGGYDLLIDALARNHRDIAKLLLLSGCKVDKIRRHFSVTPLHYAAAYGDIEIVKMLIDRSNDGIPLNVCALVNARKEDGMTPLHVATCKGHKKIVKILLRHYADVNCRTYDDVTPLHLAAGAGYSKIVKTLIKFGADIEFRSKTTIYPYHACNPVSFYWDTVTIYLQTALHIACSQGHEKVVEILLKCGADVDARNDNDMTALHLAAEQNDFRIAEILIRFGANLDPKDRSGLTPLQLAFEREKVNVAIVLLQNGTDINKPSNMCDFYFVPNCGNAPFRRFWTPDPTHECGSPKEIHFTFVQHVVIMIEENLFVDKTYLKIIDKRPALKTYLISCKKEISKMKITEICDGDIDVTFHDILTKDLHRRAIYARNTDIAAAFDSNDYKTMFPVYADILQCRFKQGRERESLLKSIIESFNTLFGYNLPSLVTNKILTYFSYKDLINLRDACPNGSS